MDPGASDLAIPVSEFRIDPDEGGKIAGKGDTVPAEPAVRGNAVAAQAFGYSLDRVRGSHHILLHPQAERLVNLQEIDGKAKPYQVRQFLPDIEEFDLKLEP